MRVYSNHIYNVTVAHSTASGKDSNKTHTSTHFTKPVCRDIMRVLNAHDSVKSFNSSIKKMGGQGKPCLYNKYHVYYCRDAILGVRNTNIWHKSV